MARSGFETGESSRYEADVMRTRNFVWFSIAFITLALNTALGAASAGEADAQDSPPVYAFTHGQWFDGQGFAPRTVYSVNGHLTYVVPARIDRTVDLAGAFVVPPFAEAHNHNIGTGSLERDQAVTQRYLAAGVFYVKIQGNLPLSAESKTALGLNTPTGLDAVFAQGASLTGTGGHPIALLERVLVPQGFLKGYTNEMLRDVRYFTADDGEELERKWPAILAQRPDFIKVILLYSEEFEKRRADPKYFGLKGLNPELLPLIVEKAHAAGLKVSTHVATGADFHAAVAAGVDEIAHLPPVTEITMEDAQAAAQRGIVVDTTYADAVPSLIRVGAVKEPDVRRVEATNLKLLRDAGVRLAIGSDDTGDTSVEEARYLAGTGMFDNLQLLRLWTETATTIFPDRKIGALKEGYEASFLALEGNPLESFENTTRIRLRVKQGTVLEH